MRASWGVGITRDFIAGSGSLSGSGATKYTVFVGRLFLLSAKAEIETDDNKQTTDKKYTMWLLSMGKNGKLLF